MKTQNKPSGPQRAFTNFASSRFLNRAIVVRELKAALKRLKKTRPDIQTAYLFGSFASGVPTPRSDADLLIVTKRKDIDGIRKELLSVPVPVDLFVWTPAAFEKNKKKAKGIAAAVFRKGIRLI